MGTTIETVETETGIIAKKGLTLDDLRKYVDVKDTASEEAFEEMALQLASGQPVDAAKIDAILKATGRQPAALEKYASETMKPRIGWSATAAALPEARTALAAIDEEREQVEAEYQRRIADLDGRRADPEERVRLGEHAEGALLRTSFRWFAQARQGVEREIQKANKVLASEPKPPRDFQGTAADFAGFTTSRDAVFVPHAEQHRSWKQRHDAWVERADAARELLSRLEPAAKAFRELGLKACPTRSEVQEILDAI